MAASVNANNAFSTLAGNITALDTTFTLAVGGSFPRVAGGDWMFVTFQDAAMNIEIMKVTAHGDGTSSFTCERGQEGTSARAWITGDIVECRFTAGSTVTTDGVQTLTNKTFTSPSIRFGDGSLALPGISWQNEPTTGFTRLSPTVMAVSINTQNVMQWQPSATVFQAPAYFPNSSSVNFLNAAGSAHWEAMHASGDNMLHLGRIGWSETRIYAANAQLRVQTHGGGVSLYGTVYGVTKDMVGLGNVHNNQQILNLRGGAHMIYIGWNGMLDCQVDGTYFGTTWPINITGNAATCSGNAGTASTAANALNICNIGGWRYSNADNNPAYVWATNGNTQDNFLCHRPSMSVNYANTAGYAHSAGNAGNADNIGGQPAGNFLKSSNGSIRDMKIWQDGNDWIWLEIAANGNYNALGGSPTFSHAVELFGYGPTRAELASKVELLEARLAALEAR